MKHLCETLLKRQKLVAGLFSTNIKLTTTKTTTIVPSSFCSKTLSANNCVYSVATSLTIEYQRCMGG
ncbi:hypothetical protein EB796_002823 [Bugula neritina]|uniref:Uncharacterized protein n=1 Tax=Bugula neritina TaxID=10212 RepID=A0A7J7KJI7_BUGNE|nr:hypothetical protein EB796_002823 [Bugula neritina]